MAILDDAVDEHAAFEWAEFNVPEEIRALPPQPSPLGRRVMVREALNARHQAPATGAAPPQFWLWARRPI